MTHKQDICWSPIRSDEFMVVDADLNLYKLERYTNGIASVTQTALTRPVSEYSTALRLCTGGNSLLHQRCYDWHPKSSAENLIAVGYASGRVLLTSPSTLSGLEEENADKNTQSSDFLASVGDASRLFGKEFIPKHSRPCHCVRWNTLYPQWLAVGLDRHRADNGVFIWDILSRSSASTSIGGGTLPTHEWNHHQQQQMQQQQQQQQPQQPIHEYAALQQSHAAGVMIDHRRARSGDASAINQSSSSAASLAGSVMHQQQYTRAMYEFGVGESALSIAWLKQSPKTLACGLSGKAIRLYDTRDVSRPQTQIQTKAVYGLTVDPFSDQRLCSYFDNQLFLWDLRRVEKPLLVIADQRSYAKIQWDPVRRNIFSSLIRDSSVVKVYYLQQIVAEEEELCYTESHIQPTFIATDEDPSKGWVLVDYDWHPKEECHLLALNSLGAISDVWLNERLCVQWSPDGARLLASFGKLLSELKQFQFDAQSSSATGSPTAAEADEDVCAVMLRRASAGYGVTDDESRLFKHNSEICVTDSAPPALSWTWLWMNKLKSMKECEPSDAWPYDISFPGALYVLTNRLAEQDGGGTNVEYKPMAGIEASAGHTAVFRVYYSVERDRITQLCGWGNASASSRDRFANTGDSVFQELLEINQPERAAAIALFTLRLKLAVQVLTKAASLHEEKTHLQLVALALAGYQGSPSDREYNTGIVTTSSSGSLNSAVTAGVMSSTAPSTSLWIEQCNNILPKLADPYLKAMFKFLCSRATGGNYVEPILESEDFPLHDKVAFAATFAPDTRLEELLRSLTSQYVGKGDLHGLLLTGLSTPDSMELIQNYVDTTGDVQTAALLLINGGKNKSETNQRDNTTHRIIDSYYALLDAFGFCHIRAQTNAMYVRFNDGMAGKITPQVYITCTYCSRSIWAGTGGRMRQRMHKLGSCPSCKKPLPRCALCRLNVGVPLAADQESTKPSKFGSWFSWCQTCRHGGHAQHLSDWFQMHNECPVTGCTCKCASLDASSDFCQSKTDP